MPPPRRCAGRAAAPAGLPPAPDEDRRHQEGVQARLGPGDHAEPGAERHLGEVDDEVEPRAGADHPHHRQAGADQVDRRHRAGRVGGHRGEARRRAGAHRRQAVGAARAPGARGPGPCVTLPELERRSSPAGSGRSSDASRCRRPPRGTTPPARDPEARRVAAASSVRPRPRGAGTRRRRRGRRAAAAGAARPSTPARAAPRRRSPPRGRRPR